MHTRVPTGATQQWGWHPSPATALFPASLSYTFNGATLLKQPGDKEASGNIFWLGPDRISSGLGVPSELMAFLLCFTIRWGSSRLPAAWPGALSSEMPSPVEPFASQLTVAASNCRVP